jgi:hypothetical protein
VKPKRIRLSRAKGWRKPEGAVVVARPSKWGNPFTIAGAREAGYEGTDEELRAMCVSQYRAWLCDPEVEWAHGADKAHWIIEHVSELAGRDLACWCPLDRPCHADVLLELANGDTP